jgi:hypothetical protein
MALALQLKTTALRIVYDAQAGGKHYLGRGEKWR